MRHQFPRLGWAVLLGLVAGLTGLTAPGLAAPATVRCAGAVVRTVDAGPAGPLPDLCVAAGGVVRLVNLGPGSVTAQPPDAVDCFYAAGTHQCRLLRPGTVRLTLAPDGRQLTVRVPAAVPGQPSTACAPPGAVVDLDTGDELGWWAPCLRLGATLRIVNLGPGLLAKTPADAVTCRYEAGIHTCQFRRPGAVVFTATLDTTTRSVTAVAVR